MRIVIVLALAAGGCAPRGANSDFDKGRALERVEQQLAFGPRYPGSPGHAAEQQWLAQTLAESGWQTESQSFQYRGTTLTNLSAHLDRRTGPFILIGAHYDTRRLADRDPSSPDQPVPGANDGASGVAVLLELARVLHAREPACDVGLVFFDGEDNGLLDGWEWAVGARQLAASLDHQPTAVVVVDMVGDKDLSLPIERNSSPDLAAEIWSAAEAKGLSAFRRDPGPAILDDHTPFLERGWPAVDIIDIDYPAWHTVGDTLDKVSADSLAQVGEALLAWLTTACPSAGN